MDSPLPEHLAAERRAVEAHLRAAFAGVTREGGVSWRESVVADNCGSDEEAAAARALDRESSWEQLVDDPAWDHEPSLGGFNFLDPIGFRYYLAPALIRCLRGQGDEFIAYALRITGEFEERLAGALTPPQRWAVARFVRFMVALHAARGDDSGGEPWRFAYKVYWRAWDRGSPG